MSRALQIVDKPSVTPFVCIMCGSGPTSREHFVDLGIDSEMHSHDQFQTHHITDGVIYLCNICMTSVISSYLQKLFTFVNQQKTGHELHAMQNSQAMFIQQDEITHLRNQVTNLEGKLRRKTEEIQQLVTKDFSTDAIADKQIAAEKTADQVLGNLFGETQPEVPEVIEEVTNDTTDSTRESDDSDSNDGNSDASGTDQSSDGDSPAAQPLIASDIFDLKRGSLIRGN